MSIGIKNVLSIDIDYIMAPTIQLYNYVFDLMDEGGKYDLSNMSYEDYWNEIENITGVTRFLEYDQEKYDAVKNLCLNVAEYLPNENIYFAKEHDAILTFLCQDKEKVNYIYDIYNVDHHHDIYYNRYQKEEVERFNFVQCAAWVWYLYKNKKLHQYFWIRNDNSKFFPFLKGGKEIEDLACIEFYSMNDIKNVKSLEKRTFDYLFICRSNYYFPFKFEYLYSNLRKEISTLKGFDFPMDVNLYCGEDKKTRFPIK